MQAEAVHVVDEYDILAFVDTSIPSRTNTSEKLRRSDQLYAHHVCYLGLLGTLLTGAAFESVPDQTIGSTRT